MKWAVAYGYRTGTNWRNERRVLFVVIRIELGAHAPCLPLRAPELSIHAAHHVVRHVVTHIQVLQLTKVGQLLKHVLVELLRRGKARGSGGGHGVQGDAGAGAQDCMIRGSALRGAGTGVRARAQWLRGG